MLCVWSAGINGYLYGNLPGLSMCQGNKIHWHMFALGNEVILSSCCFMALTLLLACQGIDLGLGHSIIPTY